MIYAEALIWIGAILLLFSAIGAVAEFLERRDDRALSRRFRENQRLWRHGK